MHKIKSIIKELPSRVLDSLSTIAWHLMHFWGVWLLLLSLLIISALSANNLYTYGKWILVVLVIYLCCSPMNAVYGLIGTTGNIRQYLRLIIIINLIFSCIYYWGFFKNAGISYDMDQPYISYGMFKDAPKDSTSFTYMIPHEIKGMDSDETQTLYISTRTDKNGVPFKDTVIVVSPAKVQLPYYEEEHTYQRIGWVSVLQNTVLTSLMQDPTDLFAKGAVYYDLKISAEQNLNGCDDRMMSRMFSWILVLQIFISWIFFGVFISILYNKFRYES